MMLVIPTLTRNASEYLKSITLPMLYLVERSLALAEPELVQKSENELSMLEHVLRINVLEGIIGCVDVGVTVFECRLEDERSRVPVPSSGTVIRARVAANAIDALNVSVLQICQPAPSSKVRENRLTSSMTRPIYSFNSGSVKSVIRPKLSGLPASSVAFVYPTMSWFNIAHTSLPAFEY
jgi:hypothetical protein